MYKAIDYSRFKTDINLTQYASFLGYEVDGRKSTKSSIAMRKDGDKVIISRKGANWVYFSVTDDSDNGSIIDFVQKRTNQQILDIGKDLNAWLGGGVEYPNPKTYVSDVEEQHYDPERIKFIFSRTRVSTDHAYLKNRGLSSSILASTRFKGRIFTDRHTNVIFPHYQGNEICGIEYKQTDKGFFAKGSQKTLWRSNIKNSDTCLIIGEAVIDALSYAQIHKNDKAFYVATGGGMSPEQEQIIGDLVESLPNIQEIIIITDNDEGGDKLTTRIQAVIAQSETSAISKRHSPDLVGQDWNNILTSIK